MAKHLVNLETAARTARKGMSNPQGISGDLDLVAERISKGKSAKAVLHDGSTVWGKVTWVTNAGFRGIEVTLLLKNGTRRTTTIEKVRIYQER